MSAGPAAGHGHASDTGRRVHRRAIAERRRTQNSVGGAETRSQSSVGESGITGEPRQGLAFFTQVFHSGGLVTPRSFCTPGAPLHFLGSGDGVWVGGMGGRMGPSRAVFAGGARARAEERAARVRFAPRRGACDARRAKVARGRAGRGAGNRLSVIMR